MIPRNIIDKCPCDTLYEFFKLAITGIEAILFYAEGEFYVMAANGRDGYPRMEYMKLSGDYLPSWITKKGDVYIMETDDGPTHFDSIHKVFDECLDYLDRSMWLDDIHRELGQREVLNQIT